ncbi:Imm50 family immunity protein [Arenicella xantha]|uniref:Immunity protein 50 of polymorphic toxin system n=1 Tax=Arenicella xantha TaxID=644221 RepID=A0A395JE69_9GAMM|nr:Imm50 family immunity protein [Arenicella xantha]RBP45613.1 immunity protein 50 of polymorphic toxin system [Arenicella xantha]
MITDEQLVIDYFGYWPKFCDGRISEFSIKFEKRILICIFYIDSDLDKRAAVELEFSEIDDVQLGEIGKQNIIDELKINLGSSMEVELAACVGLAGSFSCKKAKVLNVHT